MYLAPCTVAPMHLLFARPLRVQSQRRSRLKTDSIVDVVRQP